MQDFTNFTPNSRQPGVMARSAAGSEALFFQKVYTWMFAGLALTALASYVLAHSATFIMFLVNNSWAIWVGFACQLGLVFFLSARIQHMTPAAAKGIFLAYSALTGACLSPILLVYTGAAFIKAFVCTAGIYGAMAVYGLVTKRSLQAWGSFLFMGLIGLIIASVVNWFTRSTMMEMAICVIGVFIFAGLTAYDHQKLRVIFGTALQDSDEDEVSRVVVLGALNLYLDFINIFLFLLRLFGSARD
ncbi:MAG: Bax inhibitor-1/YccA family protein [Candidatus Adiutrix sp.]|jgi:FtsH-binding integral membrane protein|nr:Bax inhibitor-1/YccA family protein [Candidatus Adiutrix sp.]